MLTVHLLLITTLSMSSVEILTISNYQIKLKDGQLAIMSGLPFKPWKIISLINIKTKVCSLMTSPFLFLEDIEKISSSIKKITKSIQQTICLFSAKFYQCQSHSMISIPRQSMLVIEIITFTSQIKTKNGLLLLETSTKTQFLLNEYPKNNKINLKTPVEKTGMKIYTLSV